MLRVLIEEPVALPPNEDLTPDVNIDDFWIYKNPTADEINDLLKISKCIRILIKNNDYYVASGKYYTHFIMSIYLRSYTHLKNEREYDASFIVEKGINGIYNAMANRDKEKESFMILAPLYDKIKSSGLINDKTIITSDWGDSIFEGQNLKYVLDFLETDKIKKEDIIQFKQKSLDTNELLNKFYDDMSKQEFIETEVRDKLKEINYKMDNKKFYSNKPYPIKFKEYSCSFLKYVGFSLPFTRADGKGGVIINFSEDKNEYEEEVILVSYIEPIIDELIKATENYLFEIKELDKIADQAPAPQYVKRIWSYDWSDYDNILNKLNKYKKYFDNKRS